MQRWALALVVVALAGCGQPSERKLVDDAKALIEKKDLRSAVIHLKTALQHHPESAEVRFLLGSALLRSGDGAGAAVELQKAKDMGHAADVVLPAHAEALLLAGQPRKVVELYADTVLQEKKSEAALKAMLATAHHVLGDARSASVAIDAALALDARNSVAQLLAARRTAAAGDLDGALQQVQVTVAANPGRVDALLFRGDLLWLGKQQLDAALKAYRDALATEPGYLPAHSAVLRLLLQRGEVAGFKAQLEALRKVAPNHPTTRFFDVQMALLESDLPRARAGVQALMQVAAGDPAALHLAGLVESRNGTLKQAESHLVKALQLSPDLDSARRLLAEVQLRTGQTGKAQQTLQPMLARTTVGADSLALAARVQLQLGELGKAGQLFAQAALADPTDTKAGTAAALAQISRGSADAGFSQLESLAATDKTAYADLALITARLQRNELDAALAVIDRLVAKSVDKALPHLLRGRVLQARKDAAGARASFERALNADPMNFPAVQSLAAMDIFERKPEQARKRYEDLLVRDPKNHLAVLALAELRQQTGDKPEQIEALLQDAVKLAPAEVVSRVKLVEHLLAQRQVKAATAAAQDGLAAVGDNAVLLDALGRAQLAAGDVRQALSTFNKVAAQRPNDPQPQLRLAEAYFSNDDRPSAAQSLRRALVIQPDSVAAQRGLVKLALLNKRVDEALQVARQVQRQRPQAAVGFQMEGEIHQQQSKPELALAAFKTALEREPSTVNATRLHALYAGGGRGPDAARLAETWQRSHPRDAAFLFYLGTAAVATGDAAAAETLYRKVLVLEPNNASVLNNLAWVLVNQGKPGAVPLAEQANKLLADRAPFMDTLAMAYAAEKQWAKAIEWQRKALEREPQAHQLRLALARHLASSGDRAGARLELEKLAALGSSFDRQAEVASLLQTL